MMPKILRSFWIVSLLLFMGALLLIYAFLPQEGLRITSDKLGWNNQLISHELFFYISLLVALVSNILLFLLYRLLLLTGRASKNANALLLRKEIASWMLAFAGSLNLFYIFVMTFLVVSARNEPTQPGLFALLVYSGPIIILAMFALLGYILMRRKG